MPTHSYGHDVVVVGARAAGAATALLLARLGYDVVLVDRAVFPADTLSTHQIARTGVEQLHRWGLLEAVLNSGAPAIRRVTFTVEGQSTTRAIKDKAGVDLLVAPRRYILDTLVAEAAAAAGADVRLGVTITGVHLNDAGRATGVYGRDGAGAPLEIDARFVVGADGLRSRVARAVGAEIIEDRGDDGAGQYAYYTGIRWDGIELIVADRALTGVFPTHDNQACIWICSPSADAHAARRRAASREDAFSGHLDRTAPDLARRLRAGRRTSAVTGMLRNPTCSAERTGPAGHLSATPATTATRSPDTASATPTATPSCWPARSIRRCAAPPRNAPPWPAINTSATRRCETSSTSPAPWPATHPSRNSSDLQKRLSAAIDVEAATLAATPVPGNREHALA
jgi:2-polyprenyl-6-methoxyphenol hydroxylase-like FAD-dependent oxidoreductase